MPGLLNRSAVIITPKKKFIRWVNEVDDSGELKITEKESKEDPNVYLVNEAISSEEEEIRGIMEMNYLEIAIEEFSAWWTVDDDWPLLKNLKEFEEYFLWSYHDMVVDVVDDELVADET